MGTRHVPKVTFGIVVYFWFPDLLFFSSGYFECIWLNVSEKQQSANDDAGRRRWRRTDITA